MDMDLPLLADGFVAWQMNTFNITYLFVFSILILLVRVFFSRAYAA